MKVVNYKSKKIWIPFLGFILFLMFVFHNNSAYVYFQNIDRRGIGAMRVVAKKIDIVGFAKSVFNPLQDEDYIDLTISKKQRKKLKRYLKTTPVTKDWVKGSFSVNGVASKVKLKFHGTNKSHYENNIFSYSIKAVDSTCYKSYQKIKVIKGEEADPSIIAVNRLAREQGLISAWGSMKILRINDDEKGFYYVVEQINNTFLEREFGFKRYAILRNTSDWSRKEGYGMHCTDNDLYVGHIRTTEDSLFSKALYQFKLLSDHISNNRLKEVTAFFDKKYISKYLAFMTLFNDAHFISGDNLKLIYNFDTEKFYPVYRGETLGVPINKNVDYKINFSNFDRFMFSSHNEKYKSTKTALLFKTLLGDKDIYNRRNAYLYKLVNQKDELLDKIDLVYEENARVMLHSTKSRRKNEMVNEEQKTIVSTMLQYASAYLKYNHIYGSYNEQGANLSLFSDGYSPVSIHLKSSGMELAKQVNGLKIDQNLDTKSIYNTINFDKKLPSVNDLVFINEVTKDTIPSTNIHINVIDTTYQPQRIIN